MQRVESEEQANFVQIREYIENCLPLVDPALTWVELRLEEIWVNSNHTFYHVLIHYGKLNRFLVVIVDNDRRVVYGHYMLDLNREYGLDDEGWPKDGLTGQEV